MLRQLPSHMHAYQAPGVHHGSSDCPPGFPQGPSHARHAHAGVCYGWRKSPSEDLDRIWQSGASLVGTKPPAMGIPAILVSLGCVDEDIAGAYGSADRKAWEQEAFGKILASGGVGPSHIFGVHFRGSRATPTCALVLNYKETDEAVQARQAMADEGGVEVTVRGRNVLVPCRMQVGRLPPGLVHVVVYRLAPEHMRVGAITAILDCAGLQAAEVVAEYGGELVVEGRGVPGVCRSDTLVGVVRPPAWDKHLLALPPAFHDGIGIVDLKVQVSSAQIASRSLCDEHVNCQPGALGECVEMDSPPSLFLVSCMHCLGTKGIIGNSTLQKLSTG